MEEVMMSSELHPKQTTYFRILLLCIVSGTCLMLVAQAPAIPGDEPVIVSGRTPAVLKPYAIALGLRLQWPGRERISATGNITYFDEVSPRTETVRITWQIPMKVRLQGKDIKLIFDRNNPGQTASLDRKKIDMIRTLLEDGVEGFFALQKGRISFKYLGTGFKLEGSTGSDPGMDVILMTFPDIFRHNEPVRKSYWFNSSTKLLGVVAYNSPSGTSTHTVIDDWRDVSGEKLPFRIERWEDNKLIMRLALDSALFTAGVNDGTFGDN
jgi:hypothetical protein